jgi:hypothetical protein
MVPRVKACPGSSVHALNARLMSAHGSAPAGTPPGAGCVLRLDGMLRLALTRRAQRRAQICPVRAQTVLAGFAFAQ